MGRAGMKRSKRRPAPRKLPKVGEPRRPPTLAGTVRTWFLRFPADEVVPAPGNPLLPVPSLRPTRFRWAGYIACALGIAAAGAVARRRSRSAAHRI